MSLDNYPAFASSVGFDVDVDVVVCFLSQSIPARNSNGSFGMLMKSRSLMISGYLIITWSISM